MAIDKSFQCDTCNKKFLTLNSLNQHKNKVGHNKIITKEVFSCPTCNKNFQSKKALTQHLQTTITKRKPFQCIFCQKRFKAETDLTQHLRKCSKKPKKKAFLGKKKNQKVNNKINKSKSQKNIDLYENPPILERIKTWVRKILNIPKKILLDECIGTDPDVFRALEFKYNLFPLPKNLHSHSDKNLRLICKEKNWGLVSRDYEMTILAKNNGIHPVYFLSEKKGMKVLIRISKQHRVE